MCGSLFWGSVKLFPNLEAALKGVFNWVLTTLRLDANKIGAEQGAKADRGGAEQGQRGPAVVTELELGGNEIGDDGAKATAEALKVNAVLTKLGLQKYMS
jgi:hypothetical protein